MSSGWLPVLRFVWGHRRPLLTSDPALLALTLHCALLLQERILQCGGVEAAAAATAATADSADVEDSAAGGGFAAQADSGDNAIQAEGGAGSTAASAPTLQLGNRHSRDSGTLQRLGAAMLFFGCRRRDQDYLYGGLLQGWAEAGVLELHTAFSREKVLVLGCSLCSPH